MPRIPWWVKHSYGEEIWKFSPSTITSSLLVTGQHFLEISLIALFFDQAIVALYALPLRLLNGYDLILRALLANYFPQAGKLANSAADKPFTALMSRYAFGTSGLFLLISTLLIAFAGQVLHILGGEKYLASIPILSVMVLGTVFQPMSKVFGSALEVTGKPQWNTFLLTGAMFCSMALVFTAAITFQEITYVAVPVALVRLLHGITAGILANRATKQYFAKT
jgi:O-antigen/teichoic acid export membrane protein